MRQITPLMNVTLFLVLTLTSFGQEHDKFEGWCSRLETASSPDLVQFLNSVIPNEENGRCVTWAIHRLGKERYEPAIPSLVRLLDFRRPQTEGEDTMGGFGRVIFPAPVALELVGQKALPELLRAIEVDRTSERARQSAVEVWMEIYRHTDEHPKGVADLAQEDIRSKDDAIKRRLKWAVQKAVTLCDARELAACQRAAEGAAPEDRGTGPHVSVLGAGSDSALARHNSQNGDRDETETYG